MAQEIEQLVVKLLGDASSFRAMASQSVGALQSLGATVAQQTRALGGIQTRLDSMGGSFGSFAVGMAGVAGSLVGITSGFDILKDSISLAAEAESNEIAFGTMLQSAELGKQMVADLQQFAAATPLDAGTLQAATKTLLQFGTAGGDIIPTLRMLGDTVNGDAQKLRLMALAFGQASGAGKLQGQDMMQMINAGFNPLQEISRTTGQSMGDLRKQMERGAISMDMVKAAFKSATSAGGMFHNGMEKASKSTEGLFSTMLDDIDTFKRALGKDIIEGLNLKGVMQLVSAGAQKLKEFFDGLDKGTKGTLLLIPVILAGAATAMLGLVVAAKLASLAFGVFTGVMSLLQVNTVLNVASWVAWTAASLAASAVSLVFKAALWLVNFALTTTNVLLGGLAAAMAVVIAVGFVGVVIALAAGMIAVYTAGKQLIDLLAGLPGTTGPIKAITDLFGGWAAALKNIVIIAQKDLPAAWELLQLEFAVAVAQVKDLWTPLWEFIEKGFGIVSHAVAQTLEFEFKRSFLNIATEAADFFDFFGIANKVTGMKDELALMNAEVDTLQKSSTRVATTGLKGLVSNFDKQFKEGDATKAAKANRDFWMDWFGADLLAEEGESIWTRLVKGIGPEMARGGAAIEDTQKKAKALKDEFKNVDAVAFGGAEHLSRLAAYTAGLDRRPTPGSYAATQDRKIDAAQVAGPEAQGRGDAQLAALKRIEELLEKGNERPVAEVEEAALA